MFKAMPIIFALKSNYLLMQVELL